MNAKMMKSFAFGLAAAVALSSFAVSASADERKVATLAPSGSAWMNILEKGARKLEEATEGRVKTKYYAGGSQGDEIDVVRKLRLKQLDGAALTSVGLSAIYPGIRVMQLPFMFESEAEIDYVRGKMWGYFQKKFEKEGFKLLAPGDVGWAYLYSRKPLASEADLKSVKFWAWGDDPIVRAFFEKLKINSVPLGVPEVLGALKTNRINAFYGSPLSSVALQWYTEATHVTSEPFGYTVGGLVVRKDVFDKMSAKDKKTELAVSKKVSQLLIKLVRKDNKRALKAMKKSGIKVVNTPPAMYSKLKGDAEQIWRSLQGKVYTKAELEMVLKYRAEFRAKNK